MYYMQCWKKYPDLSHKGITSRICQLLFVDATFKVVPPPQLKAHALLVVPYVYDLATGCLKKKSQFNTDASI